MADNYDDSNQLDGGLELLPDMVELVNNADRAAYRELLAETNAACQAALDGIAAEHGGLLAECVSACDLALGNCQACLLAEYERSKAKIDGTLNKLEKIARSQLESGMSFALNYVNSIGVPRPSESEIIEAYNAIQYDKDPSLGMTPTLAEMPIPVGSVADNPFGRSPIQGPEPPQDGGGDIQCPEGFHNETISNPGVPDQNICVADGDHPPDGGPGCPPPYHISTVPGPDFGRCVPPDKPPDLPPDEICIPDSPATPIDCGIMRPTPPHQALWVTVECLPNGTAKVCRFRGVNPPDYSPPAQLVTFGPPWPDEDPSEANIQEAVDQLCELKRCGPAHGDLPEDKDCPSGFHRDAATGKCVPDAVVSVGGSGGDWGFPSIGWCQPDDKGEVKPPTIAGIFPSTSASGPTAPGAPEKPRGIAWFIGSAIKDIAAIPGDIISSFTKLFGINGSDLVKSIIGTIASEAGKIISDFLPCNNDEYSKAVVTQVVLGLFDKAGLVPPSVTVGMMYAQNYNCQFLVPSQAEIDNAKLRGILPANQWETATRMHGICVPWQEQILKANASKPDILGAINLQRRERLNDEQFRILMQYNGVQDEYWDERYKVLAEALPGPSDIVTMMLRDVADPAVVESGELDKDFDTKFSGRLKDYAKWQGISDDYMRDIWRAHWKYPSDTQAFDMLHRLRKEDRDENDPNISLIITQEDIVELLKINDMSPGWIDYLIATSYRPLTRVDTKRAWVFGALTDDQLRQSYRDQGYDARNAKVMADFTMASEAGTKAKLAGKLQPNAIISLYKSDGINEVDAIRYLLETGMKEDKARVLLRSADVEKQAKLRVNWIAKLKRRFLQGDFGTEVITERLSSYGINPQRVSELVYMWKEELFLKHKLPSVANLCDWFTRGYITAATYLERLGNLGYTASDAANFVGSCSAKDAERRIREARKLAREEGARREKERKESERIRRESLPCRPRPKPSCGSATTRRRSTVSRIVPPDVPNGVTTETVATDYGNETNNSG